MVGMVFSEAKDTSQKGWNLIPGVKPNVKKHPFFDGHPLRKETPKTYAETPPKQDFY